ncbi:MAG: HAMP domain-containing histidine kinase [Oligoflexia bacterium]|nr:HAMP domain-containing histidine kinase [Oligoflexia bacterium]
MKLVSSIRVFILFGGKRYFTVFILFVLFWHTMSLILKNDYLVEMFQDNLKQNLHALEETYTTSDLFNLNIILKKIKPDLIELAEIEFVNKPKNIPLNTIVVGKQIKDKFFVRKYTSDVVSNGLKIGVVNYYIDLSTLNRNVFADNIGLYLALSILIIGFIYLSNIQFLSSIANLKKSLNDISKSIENGDAESLNKILQNKNSHHEDFSSVISKIIFNFLEGYKKNIEIESKLKTNESLSKLASQVSHDIRSPLAALNMAIKRIDKSLPEEERILLRSQVRRIQDIANDLLSKKKELAQGKVINPEQLSNQLLSSCIDEIITEKRLQYRQFLDLNIEGDLDSSYGLFAKINLVEFKRVISNLINNSVDAFSDKKGKVIVHLLDADDTIEVMIEDNGKGIPAYIVNKLGHEGVSHGKENSKDSGSGLGLYHAKTTIEKWGGNFKIESTEGVGTKIILSLPKVQAPSWFVPNIELKSDAEIVILDDDSGIHATWADKLNKLGIDKTKIKVNHISNPNDLDKWISSNTDYAKKNVIYLFDFELIGFKESGLDLIEKYKLPKAILVTSHYEEDKIQIRCKELNVKLIPKMIAGLVPIKITAIEASEVKAESANIIYDALYLDDDTYLRGGWEKAAKNKGVKLITISKPSEFYQYEKNLSKDSTDIYLDSNLGDGEIKGEEFAVELHKLGYKKISMASGYAKEYFSHVGPWLECTGKDSPWEEEW